MHSALLRSLCKSLGGAGTTQSSVQVQLVAQGTKTHSDMIKLSGSNELEILLAQTFLIYFIGLLVFHFVIDYQYVVPVFLLTKQSALTNIHICVVERPR